MDKICSRWHKPSKLRGKKSELARAKVLARWNKTNISCAPVSLPVNNNAIFSENMCLKDVNHKKSGETANYVSVSNAESQVAKKSRTEKKFDYFSNTGAVADISNTSTYTMMHSSMWSILLQNLTCENCGKNELTVNSTATLGYSTKLELTCQLCQNVYGTTFSSPRISESRQFEVNKNVVQAFLNMGKGHAAMETFSMSLGIETMDRKTFDKYVLQLVNESKHVRESILEMARKAVRDEHEIVDPSLCNKEIIDIGVSFDGTWHKRGHSSLYCIGSVIDILTGLVIDFTVLSKYCHDCAKTAADLKKDTMEYAIWYEAHKSSGICEKNFDGSSGSMEMFAAEKLWKRSIDCCKMRYTVVLSDGDAKTYSHLLKHKVYGETRIEKEECINHIAKRLGTALRNKVKEHRIKGECLGGKKQGQLTENTITKLSNFYRKAITDNAPDMKKMKTAIFASLYHCLSTNEKPQHQKCPSGSMSWCFYNRAAALGLETPDHKKMKTVLSANVVSKIIPVYQRLASDGILRRCTAGKTQNSNESLHNSIWRFCPKDTFVSKKRIEFAALSGIGQFNMGCVKNLCVKESNINSPSISIAKRRDKRRLKQSVYRNTNNYKSAYIAKKYKKCAKEKKKARKEGVTYSAGAF